MPNPVTIIAEAEINHNGRVDLATNLIDAAKAAKADLVKFQCFVTDTFIAPGSSFIDIFRDTELSLDQFREIKQHADQIELPMISTAGDADGLKMIVDLGLPTVKIGSTNITNLPLLEAVSETGLPVYLSTGASYLEEVRTAVDIVSQGTDEIVLFHCTVQYPASSENLNLRAIPTLANAFPDIAIGYSDHSMGSEAACLAVALGARYLEKHFTLSHELEGPDHQFSADPSELSAYVSDIRETERMLGGSEKQPTEQEMAIRIAGRRYLTVTEDIKEGDIIGAQRLLPRRIDALQVDATSLIPPMHLRDISRRKAARNIAAGSAISEQDLI